MALELAKAIRLFDKDANISIREGKKMNGDFIFTSEFDLRNTHTRYSDLRLMFKNSVEKVGGTLLSAD